MTAPRSVKLGSRIFYGLMRVFFLVLAGVTVAMAVTLPDWWAQACSSFLVIVCLTEAWMSKP